MHAVEVVEVDVDQLRDVDRRALVAFEQTMWAEHAPEEPSMAEEPALWLATQRRPNAKRVTWVVRAEAGNEMAGVATLSLPLADNQHLGNVELRVAPPYRRQRIARHRRRAGVVGGWCTRCRGRTSEGACRMTTEIDLVGRALVGIADGGALGDRGEQRRRQSGACIALRAWFWPRNAATHMYTSCPNQPLQGVDLAAHDPV